MRLGLARPSGDAVGVVLAVFAEAVQVGGQDRRQRPSVVLLRLCLQAHDVAALSSHPPTQLAAQVILRAPAHTTADHTQMGRQQ